MVADLQVACFFIQGLSPERPLGESRIFGGRIMRCRICQKELRPGISRCECGCPVPADQVLGFPCVICGMPIPPDAEGCPNCSNTSDVSSAAPEASAAEALPPSAAPSAGIAPEAPRLKIDTEPSNTSQTPTAPLPVTPPEAMDEAELSAFELEEINIEAAPPPPPPPAPVSKVERHNAIAPLPTLMATPEPAPEPVRPPKPVAAEPVPVSEPTAQPAPLAAPTPKPAPAPTPAVAAPPPQPKPVPAPAMPAPAPAPKPAPVVIRPLTPEEEEELGPQPEDVVDEELEQRKRLLRKIGLIAAGIIVVLGAWALLVRMDTRARRAQWLETPPAEASRPAPAAPAVISAPAAAPAAVASKPAEVSTPEEADEARAAAKSVEAKPEAAAEPRRKTEKPASTPKRARSEDDAYMRQIRRQLQQR